MKVNYEYTKKDLKKYLLRSRTVNNIVLLVIGTIIYLICSLGKVSLLYLPLFIIGLMLFIYLLNQLYIILYIKANDMMNNVTYGKYTLELTPNKFSLTQNKRKTDYKYNTIKKIVEHKNLFIVRFKKSREYLTFEKHLFTEEEYIKAINMFKEKSSK